MSTVQNSLLDTPSPTKYKKYPYRFVISAVFDLLCLTNIMMYITFAPLITQLQKIYNLSLSTATFCTLIISDVSYVPSTFIANFVIDKLKLRNALIVGAFMTTIGLWLRTLAKQNFYWIFAGQTIAGLAQAFFYATPAKISAIWYPPEERPLATTVMVSFMTLGNGIGTFVPQWFVDPNAENEEALDQLEYMMWVYAFQGTACLMLAILLLKDAPPSAPSKSATVGRYGFMESMKKLLTNKNYLTALFLQSFLNGNLLVVFMVLQPMIQPFGIGQNEAGNMITIGIVAGTGLSLVIGAILQRTHKYKSTLIGFSVLGTATWAGAMMASFTNYSMGIVIGAIVYMSIQNAVLPGCEELTVEISYPVAEEAAAGVFLMLFQLYATLLTLVADWILTDNPGQQQAYYVFILLTGISVVGVVMFLFIKEDLRRRNFENKHHVDESIEPEQQTPIFS